MILISIADVVGILCAVYICKFFLG